MATRLTKAGVMLNGLLHSISSVVAEWTPTPGLDRETDYSNELRDFLLARLPEDASLQREYPHRGGHWDLRLGWKGVLIRDQLFIELKLNLQKKPELDRLIGQIDSLDPTQHALLLVLVGKTAPQCLERLEKFVPLPLLLPYPQPKVSIVRKPWSS